ncbi:hypothetical protein BGZ60DRAFT_400577 [Tricladium varicosporioides]|nr:hypothetical protein BGZ60DRAFT_400577 [Hymenoscyphus varicosporioides]
MSTASSALAVTSERPRIRAKKPKVKTGCVTCKIRRVKCDEGKPICARCSKSGYECDGYPKKDNKVHRAAPKPLLPKCFENTLGHKVNIQPNSRRYQISRITFPPSAHPRFANECEYRYFLVFQKNAAPDLSGYFDSEVWNRMVLQACNEEEYARYAVVAIGALHKTLEVSRARVKGKIEIRSGEEGSTHYTFALQQYGKALRLMRAIPIEGESETHLRNIITSSLLTTCIESCIGNQQAAMLQAEAGIDIVLKWRAAKQHVESQSILSDTRRVSASSSFLNDDLLGVFASLNNQIMILQDKRPRPRMLQPFPDIPKKFDSLKQARLCWDLFLQRVLQFSSAMNKGGFDIMGYGEGNMEDHLVTEETLRETIQAELNSYGPMGERWLKAFIPLFEHSRQFPGTKEFMAANVLMARFLPSKIKIAPKAHNSEMDADAYMHEYETVVELCRQVIEPPIHTCGRAIFNLEINVALCLLVVARRCRAPALRRKAIALLRNHPRREGFFDSMMAANVATWLMNKEEEGMVDGVVPEESRLRIVKNDFSLSERKAVLLCSKYELKDGKAGRVLLPNVILTW